MVGSGGHAICVLDILEDSGFELSEVVSEKEWASSVRDRIRPRIVGGFEKLAQIYHKTSHAVIAIGGNLEREASFRKMECNKFIFPPILSNFASISNYSLIGCGAVVMPNSRIGPDSKVGKLCIINTNSVVEHECVVGDFVHISPGAILCGRVSVGNRTWIGAGAVIRDGVSIGENCMIGAGASVTMNVPDNSTYVGVPAKPIKR